MTTSNTAVNTALEKVLAETFVLYFNTHAAHWNITGPQFAALHELFKTQYEEIHAAVDEIAERLRALDVPAPAGLAAAIEPSEVKDGVGSGQPEAIIAGLLAGHETLIATLQEGIEAADEADDDGTEDLLIGRLQEHQKMAWMLRAHLA